MRWSELKEDLDRNPRRRETMQREFPFRRVADEIVALRASAGLTQAQLAVKMKTTQSTVARFESGRHPITVRTLDRVASALGAEWRIVFEPVAAPTTTAVPSVSMVLAETTASAKVATPIRAQNKRDYAIAA
jgi:transcriptional regulator with XRE-family HTH domain